MCVSECDRGDAAGATGCTGADGAVVQGDLPAAATICSYVCVFQSVIEETQQELSVAMCVCVPECYRGDAVAAICSYVCVCFRVL